jgi:hypothetical protein
MLTGDLQLISILDWLPPFALLSMKWLQKKTIEDIDYVHQNYVDGYRDALYEILIIANELELVSISDTLH